MLIDTSGLFSCLSAREPHHLSAVRLLGNARVRLVHSSVLSELVALADARGEDRSTTLDFVAEVLDSRDFKVVWLTESDHRASLTLLVARLDKTIFPLRRRQLRADAAI